MVLPVYRFCYFMSWLSIELPVISPICTVISFAGFAGTQEHRILFLELNRGRSWARMRTKSPLDPPERIDNSMILAFAPFFFSWDTGRRRRRMESIVSGRAVNWISSWSHPLFALWVAYTTKCQADWLWWVSTAPIPMGSFQLCPFFFFSFFLNNDSSHLESTPRHHDPRWKHGLQTISSLNLLITWLWIFQIIDSGRSIVFFFLFLHEQNNKTATKLKDHEVKINQSKDFCYQVSFFF